VPVHKSQASRPLNKQLWSAGSVSQPLLRALANSSDSVTDIVDMVDKMALSWTSLQWVLFIWEIL